VLFKGEKGVKGVKGDKGSFVDGVGLVGRGVVLVD
jgi:hypothetical protein